MGNFIKTQNVFSCGEISSEFYAINNSKGVSKLENMDVLQSGGICRRKGLKSIGNISTNAILVPFAISESEKYLLVFHNLSMDIYRNDVKIDTKPAPWTADDLPKLQYAQRFNSIFFVHPNYQPRILTKTANGFNISSFTFAANSDMSLNMPFMQFDDAKNVSITITNSDIDNNHAVFTTNVDFWNNNAIGERLLVNGKQWVIESIQNAKVAIVYTNGNFTIPVNPIYDWYESVFNNRRGWPCCVSFHQNRLIFGCTAFAPNNIWMSKVGDYNNFDVGSGLDDEAIYITLLSAQHHQICTIVSSDNLQILTSVGEWDISSSPLTPSNVNIKQHTSVGSIDNKFLPPQQVEGSTIFISKSEKDIRELDLDTLNQKYNATDLCVFSKHLMNNPQSIAYNQNTHQLFVVMGDGKMAVLNKYINTDISAWASYTTKGEFKYVSVLDDSTYVIVKRGNNLYLEKFDESCLVDATNNDFEYKISAMPLIVNGHIPKKIRVRKIIARIKDTKTLFVNGERMEIPDYVYSDDSNGFSGDLSMNLLGTEKNTMNPLWMLSSTEQLPATILSVSVEGWYEI
ncbi:MAG: hypothetical protein IKZ49_01040 [Alphaproteobacteria bacterium]|nr:hypothetical protein [Alphaproteobacteria bacterium]